MRLSLPGSVSSGLPAAELKMPFAYVTIRKKYVRSFEASSRKRPLFTQQEQEDDAFLKRADNMPPRMGSE